MEQVPRGVRALRDAVASESGALSALREALHRAIRGPAAALGAYRSLDPVRIEAQFDLLEVRRRAGVRSGPLEGVPVSIKDLYGASGWDTFAGSPQPLPRRFARDGWLVRRMRAAGAWPTGKTHTVEFAFGGIGTNPHWPTPRNPWDAAMHRVPGGSSSGAGVSLHDGTAWLALGTDTAGSVRIPAAWTGTVGLKITAGRWSTEGIVPLSPTLDTPGLLARSVEDLRWAFGALDPAWGEPRELLRAWPVPSVAGLRFGVLESPWMEGCRDGVDEVVSRALSELESAGAVVRVVHLPEAHEALDLFAQGGPVAVELAAFLARELPGWRDRLDPNVAARLRHADDLPAVAYLHRIARMRRLAHSAREAFGTEGIDVLVGPTVALGPPPLTVLEDAQRYREANLLALRNTAVVSYLGLCATSLPIGLDRQSMPVGLHMAAPPRSEERLLAVAEAVERVLGGGLARLGRPPLPASEPSG